MANLHDTRALRIGLGERIAAFVAELRLALHRRTVYLRTLRELNALSDRDLADLGIHASMIRRIALEAAYGK